MQMTLWSSQWMSRRCSPCGRQLMGQTLRWGQAGWLLSAVRLAGCCAAPAWAPNRSCADWLQAWPEPERHIVISLETVRLTAALDEPCNLFVM